MARELLPNSTQIPDVILDFWLSELSGAELKVVLYIARRTYGFGKESDNISLTQICNGITKRDGTVQDTGTGLSRSSVVRAIKTLEEKGIILRKINLSETSNEHEESTYSLNLDWQPNPGSGGGGGKVVPKSNHPVSKDEGRWSQNRTTRSPKMKPGVVPKSNPQETDQETDQETAAEEKAAAVFSKEGYEILRREGFDDHAARTLAQEPLEVIKQACAWIDFRNYDDRLKMLRASIVKRYGDPRNSVSAKEHKKRAIETNENARKRAEDDRRRARIASLDELLDQFKIERPQAFLDFQAYQQKARDRLVQLSTILLPQNRKPLLEEGGDQEKTLLQLVDYSDNHDCGFPKLQRFVKQYSASRLKIDIEEHFRSLYVSAAKGLMRRSNREGSRDPAEVALDAQDH